MLDFSEDDRCQRRQRQLGHLFSCTSDSALAAANDGRGRVTNKFSISEVELEMTKNRVFVPKKLDSDVMNSVVAAVTAVMDSTAVSSAEKQKMMALMQSRQASDDDDSEWSAPAAVASVSHSSDTVDVQVAMQRHVIQTAQITVDIPQIQCLGRVADVPVVLRRPAPTIRTVQKTAGDPETKFLDLVVTYPL